jgi:hypothetical protein
MFARPGYLIDTPCESMAAPGALFTRALAHHAEVGLAPEQVMALLDLSREYHEKQVVIRVEFARLTEKLELKRGRFDAAALAAHKALLEEHAELFAADEALFFTYAARGHDLLTDEQIDRAEAVYHAEKDRGLASLAAALNSAVGPSYAFGPAAPGSQVHQ